MSCKDFYSYNTYSSERGASTEDCLRYLSLHDDDSSLMSSEDNKEYLIESPRFNYVNEIKAAPWNASVLRQTIRKVSRLRSREHLFTDKSLCEVSRILKIFLARLSKEAQRLSKKFNICTRNEVYSATQIIFSKTVSRACIGSAYQAYYLYLNSFRRTTQRHLTLSKSERAGLTISVGKIFRWLVRNRIAAHVTDSAAVYFTAVLEYLVDEICYLSDQKLNISKGGNLCNYSVLLDDIIPSLASKPDIWRGAQPYEHLCVTRFNGESFHQGPKEDKLFQTVRYFASDGATNGSAACIGSREEITSLIEKASSSSYADTPRHRSVRRKSSPSVNRSPRRMSVMPGNGLMWDNNAIDLLYEFTKCPKLQYAEDCDSYDICKYNLQPDSTLCEDAHPLSTWIKLCGVFTKSRLGQIVDRDDVREAARVLLPGCFCHPRGLWPDTSFRFSAMQEILEEDSPLSGPRASPCANSQFFMSMLQMQNKEQRAYLMNQNCHENFNKHDEKGMTLLMYACLHGNYELCKDILERKITIDVKVPLDAIENDCIPATIKGWTALSFAVVGGHAKIVKLLLDNGASPEGGASNGEDDNEVLSPFHLAAAAGHLSIFSQLLAKHPNKTLMTLSVDCNPSNDADENIVKMHPHSLAAAHGHGRILRKLIAVPERGERRASLPSNMLSLEEALTDNKDDLENDNDSLEQENILKEAMYESVEHGYIDIAMEIRSLGVPWNFHLWITALTHANEYRNKEMIRCLLHDFPEVKEEEILKGLKDSHAVLLFEIFKSSVRSSFAGQIAGIISLFYGDAPRIEVNCVEDDPEETLPKIGTKFVNKKEMADVVFSIEGEPFYAHKIILQNSSNKLQELVKYTNDKGQVNIDGIRYRVFEAAMQFLYSGGILYQSQPGRVLELLECAAKLQLPSLKQTCEYESARHMTSYNAVEVYMCAKKHKAYQLEKYSYHFFLANLGLMMSREEFKDLLDKNQTIFGYLEQEFMQTLFGIQEKNNNVVIATYL